MSTDEPSGPEPTAEMLPYMVQTPSWQVRGERCRYADLLELHWQVDVKGKGWFAKRAAGVLELLDKDLVRWRHDSAGYVREVLRPALEAALREQLTAEQVAEAMGACPVNELQVQAAPHPGYAQICAWQPSPKPTAKTLTGSSAATGARND